MAPISYWAHSAPNSTHSIHGTPTRRDRRRGRRPNDVASDVATVVKDPAHLFSSPRGDRWSWPPVIGLTLKLLKPGQPPKPCGFDFRAERRGKQWCGNGFLPRISAIGRCRMERSGPAAPLRFRKNRERFCISAFLVLHFFCKNLSSKSWLLQFKQKCRIIA